MLEFSYRFKTRYDINQPRIAVRYPLESEATLLSMRKRCRVRTHTHISEKSTIFEISEGISHHLDPLTAQRRGAKRDLLWNHGQT